jgi:hypothetical protein
MQPKHPRPRHPPPNETTDGRAFATLATRQSIYGVLTEPATRAIERLLPGPIERIWAYLTESDLRRQ